MNDSVNRRQFLAQTVAAASACNIVGRGTCADATTRSLDVEVRTIIDTHVYLGQWPHARLAAGEPRELCELLRQNNVTQAWVGSFDGLFHKDIAAANSRLAESCSKYGDGMLIPFGAVNPTLPDWEDDLRRCHEKHHMPGIRLHPGYHGYTLADTRFSQLLGLAAKAKLVVQLVVWLDDARHRWLTPAADSADLSPSSLAGPRSGQPLPATPPRLMILGSRAEDISPWKAAFSRTDVYFDFSRYSPASKQVEHEALRSSERIVFGSGTPLRPLHLLSTLLAESDITHDRRQTIEHEVAAKLIGSR